MQGKIEHGNEASNRGVLMEGYGVMNWSIVGISGIIFASSERVCKFQGLEEFGFVSRQTEKKSTMF